MGSVVVMAADYRASDISTLLAYNVGVILASQRPATILTLVSNYMGCFYQVTLAVDSANVRLRDEAKRRPLEKKKGPIEFEPWTGPTPFTGRDGTGILRLHVVPVSSVRTPDEYHGIYTSSMLQP